MSVKHKDAHRCGKILETRFRGVEYTFFGEQISAEKDVTAVSSGYILMFLLWFDLLGINSTQLDRVVGTWISSLSPIPVDAVDAVLAECDSLLLHSYFYREAELHSYNRLLQQLRGVDDRAGIILAPIRTLLVSAIQSVDGFALAHQALVFASRVTLTVITEQLEPKFIADYVSHDESVYDYFADELRPFFMRHFKYFSMKDAVGSHGPGQVAETFGSRKPSARQKYEMILVDSYTRYIDTHVGHRPPLVSGTLRMREAYLTLVPKSVRKRRIITVEPATLVWYQHAVRDALIKHIKGDAYLSRRIDLNDSDANRVLAEKGSYDGSFVTIDLSNASDSVPLLGLREALPAHMFTCITAVRSKRVVLPDHTRIELKKYAGMGNAVTFVLECLYFCAIVEQAILKAGGDPIKSKYRVYGDDIVVEVRYANSTLMELASHGFKINHLKSFVGQGNHIFRESCGGEYLDGADVTPVRLSRGFRGFIRQPGAIQGAIDFHNELDSEWIATRSYVIDWLMSLPRHLRPRYSYEYQDTGLHVQYPGNEHLISRYSEALQCNIIRTGQIKTKDSSVVGSARRIFLKRRDGKKHLSRSIIYDDLLGDSLRYYTYLQAVRNRARLIYPEDRMDIDIDLPDTTYWGSASVPE